MHELVEVRADFKALVMDTREHADDIAKWGSKAGNKLRIAHAQRALAEFEGGVDVVALDGVPGEGYGKAHPWFPVDRKRQWRLTYLEAATGHLRLEAQRRS